MYKRLPVEEKIKLIKRVRAGESVARICRDAEISRTVFYKWQKKYLQSAPRSKKKVLSSKIVYGKNHWKKLPPEIERKVLKTAIKNPSFSAAKISKLVNVSAHGVWNILKQNELNNCQKRKAYISQYGSSLIRAPVFKDKLTMIRRFKAGEKIAPLCREFCISRTTFYKWLKRYQNVSKDKKGHILHSWRPKGEKHWRFIPKAKELVLKIVVECPVSFF